MPVIICLFVVQCTCMHYETSGTLGIDSVAFCIAYHVHTYTVLDSNGFENTYIHTELMNEFKAL